MRISKQKAANAAFKMTETKRKKIDALTKELHAAVFVRAMDQVPLKVKTFPLKEYLRIADYVQIVFGSGYREVFYLDKGVPAKEKKIILRTTPVITSLWKKKKAATSDAQKLRDSIKAALLKLGTTKAVSDKFPEALPYLNPPDSEVLPESTVNITAIKAALK